MSASQSPLFEIRSSPIAGSGAFALQPIPAWTRLIEYTGERVSQEVADARYEDDEAAGNTHTVLFTVDEHTVIDAGLETIRDIEPGEELTYDYEIPREGEDDETARRKWPCHCGAPNCRGTLLLPLPTPRRSARRPAKKDERSTRRTAAGAPRKRQVPPHRSSSTARRA
jgi:hypothetical protein